MGWRALAPLGRSRPLQWLVAIAAAGFLATAALAGPGRLPALCGSLGLADLGRATLSLGRFWSPGEMLFAWLLMLAAMMPPLLALPVRHIWHSSLPARRPRALALFGLGYVAIWTAAGLALVPAVVGLGLALPTPADQLTVLALAAIWSGSPPAQAARNRCHRRLPIAIFGLAADRSCLRQGLATGAACAAACWPWMLVPMSFEGGHVAVMAAVALWLFVERLAPPAAPAWAIPPAVAVAAALARPQKVAGRP